MTRARRVEDPDESPLNVELVDRSDLSRGEFVIVLPGEQAGVAGEIARAVVPPEDVEDLDATHDGEPEIEDRGGERRPARSGEFIEADGTVQNAPVIVRVGRRGLVPWLWSLSSTSPVLYGTVIRPAIVVALLVFALAGTGFGVFNPVGDYARGTPGYENTDRPEGTATPTPPPAPPVTATPPASNGTEAPTPERSPVDPTETPPPTSTPTQTPSETPTATPTQAGGAGNNAQGGNSAAGGSVGASASLDVAVDEIRQRDGLVTDVPATLDGDVVVDNRATSVVVIVQSWVPGQGWAEVARTSRTTNGTVSLADLFGEVVLASGSRAAAFDNPADGTTAEYAGQVSVTAVMFEGTTEIRRLSATDTYTLKVTNLAGGTGELSLGNDDDSGSRALFGNGGLGAGGTNGTDSGGAGGTGADATVIAPGSNGSNTIPMTNRGSEPGTLTLSNVSFVTFENGITGPESDVDSTGGDPGRGAGELHEALELRLGLERSDGSRVWVFGNQTAYRTVDELANQTIELGTLAPNERVELVVEYRVPQSIGNEIQSDTIVVDVSFTLFGDGG